MDRALFTSQEFLILNLALNNAMAPGNFLQAGMPGMDLATMTLLRKKCLELGKPDSDGNKLVTYTVRDETTAPASDFSDWPL